ncbi:RNA polymerase sigma-54 factor [Bremerella cremea]|uniref:RNA polymerase sigma-54 factor n=1 Tax=Blastopirellula marina TaxID=124 RepID=A0A2S8FZ40_9BACT|nr:MULTISPECIES: RNA polymerase factor sigma-54 [Pirellulaceae]PQO37453.1 RNA polymerase sigma-54 factor [Blastopirellula marina]RCS49840.1 RNA polymerase sigma-54 factor [Bremerella cremea]
MRMSFGLEQKMVQKQVLAPRMIQSMEILQLPVLALQEKIEQEMNENPMLEVQEQEASDQDDNRHEEAESRAESEQEFVVEEGKDNADDFERLLEMDQQYPDTFDERPQRSSGQMEEDAERRMDALANVQSRPETLQDHLEHQLSELSIDPQLREWSERIISSLDSNGYLTTSLEDLLPADATDELKELAMEALHVVQSLEPAGVGARDLRECLLLQIDPSRMFYEELRMLIMNHLEDLRDNRLPQIQKATGFSIERIQAAWSELRRLDPKPGSIYNDAHVANVIPDLILDVDEEGNYVVQAEDRDIPQLRISNYYRERLSSPTATREEKEFIKRKLNAAQWLIDAIIQRQNTLSRVAQAIVDYQKDFIENGPEHITPLKMQQIADQVGVHVTTVSRAVDDKYIQTPRGIFPLKQFFAGGTVNEAGEEVTWDQIRLRLQEVIDNEDKAKPLSDDDLVKKLKDDGLNVARRTVTKYRKKMGIPSSRQRRDWSKR